MDLPGQPEKTWKQPRREPFLAYCIRDYIRDVMPGEEHILLDRFVEVIGCLHSIYNAIPTETTNQMILESCNDMYMLNRDVAREAKNKWLKDTPRTGLKPGFQDALDHLLPDPPLLKLEFPDD